MKKSILAAAALTGLLAMTIMPASAAPSVSLSSATADGSSATVTGTATFPPLGAESVGGVVTSFDPIEVAQAAGTDLIDATIEPISGGLRFTWIMSSTLPAIPPEVVRYTWSFGIGDNTYQLQAKSLNLASITTTEAPQDHVLQVPEQQFYQLRGACQTNYRGTPSSGCFHLAFLDGGTDPDAGTVWVDLPYETRDDIGRIVAPDFKPGVVLEEILTANMSIAASFQAVISNVTTSSYINSWEPYAVGPRVELTAGPAGASPFAPSYPMLASTSSGAFTASVPGISGTNDTVYARACDGLACSYASLVVS